MNFFSQNQGYFCKNIEDILRKILNIQILEALFICHVREYMKFDIIQTSNCLNADNVQVASDTFLVHFKVDFLRTDHLFDKLINVSAHFH